MAEIIQEVAALSFKIISPISVAKMILISLKVDAKAKGKYIYKF